MAFPTDKTNAVDNVTDVLASHLNDIEDKIGLDDSVDTDTLDYKVAQNTAKNTYPSADSTKLGTIEENADVTDAVNMASSIVGVAGKTTPIDADTVPLIDSADSNSLKELTLANLKIAILKATYPIGCIYTTIVATNPNTTFGFGTWTAFGAGKVPVGLNSGDADFNTVEETGGAKTHTLTTAEMPTHTHIQNQHRHTESRKGTGYVSSWSGGDGDFSITYANGSTLYTAYTTATNQNAGSGTAHSIVQPYIVVYMFKRTA